MSENGPHWSSPAEEALARQLAPLVKAVRQFMLDARTAKTTRYPLPLAPRLALAAQPAARELKAEPPGVAERIRAIAATWMVSRGIGIPDLIHAGLRCPL
jgi:hypothetical protein